MTWEIWLPVAGLAGRYRSRRWINADSPGAALRVYFRVADDSPGWVELVSVRLDGSLLVRYHERGTRVDPVPLPEVIIRRAVT